MKLVKSLLDLNYVKQVRSVNDLVKVLCFCGEKRGGYWEVLADLDDLKISFVVLSARNTPNALSGSRKLFFDPLPDQTYVRMIL